MAPGSFRFASSHDVDCLLFSYQLELLPENGHCRDLSKRVAFKKRAGESHNTNKRIQTHMIYLALLGCY